MGGPSVTPPGGPHEANGNVRPRWMVAGTGTPVCTQNPAYRPAPRSGPSSERKGALHISMLPTDKHPRLRRRCLPSAFLHGAPPSGWLASSQGPSVPSGWIAPSAGPCSIRPARFLRASPAD